MSNSRCINEIMSRPFSIAKSAPVTEALDKMLDDLGFDDANGFG